MRRFAVKAVEKAMGKEVDYADVRVIDRRTQSLTVKNEQLENVDDDDSLGWGLRVLCKGGWGFASSYDMSPAGLEAVVNRAVATAKASAQVQRNERELAPVKAVRDSYRSPCRIDPFEVSLEEKIALLTEATGALKVDEKVQVCQGRLQFLRDDKVFASSEGSVIEQTFVETGGGLTAFAVGEGDVQRRTYPNTIFGDVARRGWEHVKEMGLVEEAPRVGEEAVKLLTAAPCPKGRMTIILEQSQLALQIHESIGHPTELDRILNHEADFAGTSFLEPDMLEEFRYGSEIVNVTADATVPGGRGTFGYDDEGVPAQRTPLLSDGVLVGFTSSRETAARLGLESSGAARADGWNRRPLVRMTNINLEPGNSSLEEMIATTEDGLYLDTNKSWSIDDRRLNFQFGTEVAYRIENGRLGEMVKNATYTGMTPRFWGNCDAIGGEEEWQLVGYPCGKGVPGQNGRVGHGTAPARFKDVQVGVMK